MHLVRPLRTADYETKAFYALTGRELDQTDETHLSRLLADLYRKPNLELDPNCLGYKVIMTSHGEILMQRTEFKARGFFLKLIPNKYFVFIHENQRKVIPICSHLR